MPYSSVNEVPDYVPADKKKQWLEVFNSAYAAAKKDGKSDKEAEAAAFKQANAVAGPNTEKTMKTFQKFIPFAKVDVAKREVWGIVTAEVPDKEDEVCDYDKSKPYYQAVIGEFSKATEGKNIMPLREMHQLSAAGKGIGFEFRDTAKEIFMGFKVVDDDAWRKVEEGVYTGFSQGGTLVGDMVPDPKFKGCMRYVANPSEISLVDNPCLGVAHFAYVKADGTVDLRKIRSIEGSQPPVENELGTPWAIRKAIVAWRRSKEHDPQRLADVIVAAKALGLDANKLGVRADRIREQIRKRVRVVVNKNAAKIGNKRPNLFFKLDSELGRLRKGMCEVSQLAYLLDEMGYMFFCVLNEQEWEGDEDSKLPDMLLENIDSMIETLLEMVAEETTELREQIAVRS